MTFEEIILANLKQEVADVDSYLSHYKMIVEVKGSTKKEDIAKLNHYKEVYKYVTKKYHRKLLLQYGMNS